jgi:uncharacterized protein (DUF58 family)
MLNKLKTRKISTNKVRVSVPTLVRLSQNALLLSPPSSSIRSQQSGQYLSPFKGRGMEFDEVRLYQPGDDMRHIDWRVTARRGKTHTKLFHEERERAIFLLVDYRAPMFFATQGVFKSVLAAHCASLLAWSANQNNDRVGGLIFTDSNHHELKPKRGKAQILQLIKQLVKMQDTSSSVTNTEAIQQALARLRRVVRPGSLIFLISDFRYLNVQAESHLIQIAKHNEVVMLFIYDPLESQLPPSGRYRLSDGKSDITVNTAEQERVIKYHKRFEQHQAYLQKLLNRHRFLTCATTDDPIKILQGGFRLRV